MATHEYHRGDMDIHEQANTFHAFIVGTKWGSLVIAVIVLTTAIWFCTELGFVTGAVVGLLTAVAGIVLLKEKKGGGGH